MIKVYSSFEDLLEQNKSLFRFFKQKKNQGLLRAIWHARQGEIDSLREKLEQDSSSKDEQIEEFREQLELVEDDLAQKKRVLLFQEEKIKDLEVTLAKLEQKDDSRQKELERVEQHSKNLDGALTINCHRLEHTKEISSKLKGSADTLGKSLQQREKDLQGKNTLLYQLQRENALLRQERDEAKQNLAQKDQLSHSLQMKLEEKTAKLHSLENELTKRSAYIRTQRRLNKSMSDQLTRISSTTTSLSQ